MCITASTTCITVYNVYPSGYNDMKSELKDFLQRFAEDGKVRTEEL